MYKFKDVARRSSAFIGAVGLLAGVASTALPAFTSADSLNPLTQRSLTLSSSSPGWSYTDGSGNSKYAPPNSGANGKQTGNTFAFHMSSDTTSVPVKAMTFQYCTTSAGNCTSPGDDVSHGTDTATTSDLNVVTSSPAEVASGSDFSTVIDSSTGEVKAVPGVTNPLNSSDTTGQYAAKDVAGNFVVMWNNAGTWTIDSGWTMTVKNLETPSAVTSQNNYITLYKTSGMAGMASDAAVKVIFFGTTSNYITNPGSGAFFVKINTYKAVDDTVPTAPVVVGTDIIDGGVTVANVMNQSIQITTKVLETMQFSVGTVDPDTLSSDRGSNPMSPLEIAQYASAPSSRVTHTPCDPILMQSTFGDPQNVLQLGNQNAESSLEVAHTYSTHSYWRLSSNSSAGATVYYSGHTLSNTEGDQILPIGATAAAPTKGAEQFGLALDNGTDGATAGATHAVSYAQEATYENGQDNGLTSIDTSGLTTDGVLSNGSWHTPRLQPLDPVGNSTSGLGYYGGGTGGIDSSISTKFAFDANSDTIPAPLATENSQVVDCVTGKMRYMANIAATTPAGIYTTKVNYIAAPQY